MNKFLQFFRHLVFSRIPNNAYLLRPFGASTGIDIWVELVAY